MEAPPIRHSFFIKERLSESVMPTFRNPLSPPKEHGAGGKELKVRKKFTFLKRDKNYPPLYQRGVRGVVFFG